MLNAEKKKLFLLIIRRKKNVEIAATPEEKKMRKSNLTEFKFQKVLVLTSTGHPLQHSSGNKNK